MSDATELPPTDATEPGADEPKKRDRKAKAPPARAGELLLEPTPPGAESAPLPPVSELPKRKYRCRIPKCHTLPLEAWTEVEAVTPADAIEAYKLKLGINHLDASRKVEAQEV